ncbi:HNH endonuclease [Pseudomonas sp. TH15]|uniref:HNH endonuclease n=1 Tax=Pseudomonas sp. TH15 TaxID=2796381 RepID=UPI001F5BC183|nr:HNH endonuclease [Pseudomonas sp. TH15]
MADITVPDITVPVIFPLEMQTLIQTKLKDPEFSHANWGDADLEDVRCHIRNHYRDVQKGVCYYCRGVVSLKSALNCHVEHIAPKSLYREFMFEPKNLCVICADCNEIKREQEVMSEVPDTVKSGKARRQYPRSEKAFRIVQPHFHAYHKHIDVFEGFYVDLTDEGHFTIGACRLNRRIRRFGWEKEYEDAEVAATAERYLSTQDPLARYKVLRELKKKLIRV